MNSFVLNGNLVSAVRYGTPDCIPNGFLVVEDGKIAGLFDRLPDQYANLPLRDCGDALILQSFTDLHLHAPQYPMVGTGLDLPLLDWLEEYTFPTEANFANPDYARKVYRQLAKELIENGTTRVCMFSSLHREATLILMEELEKAGVTGCVGKVNMDRNSGDILKETTKESMDETIRWLADCERFQHVKPILTPRFTPSCTDELLTFLGELAQTHHLPVQSHLSENRREIEWVKELFPDCSQYWETYHKFGLWGDRTIMAHCVHSDARERKAILDAGVTVAYCASSNNNLCSGIAPIQQMHSEGLKIALGSDIAGGDTINGFEVAAASIRASKDREILDDWKSRFLTVGEAWYLATTAGAQWFSCGEGFSVGDPFHAIVLRDDDLLSPHELTVEQRFERSLYRRQKNAVQEVWSEGKLVYQADK